MFALLPLFAVCGLMPVFGGVYALALRHRERRRLARGFAAAWRQ